MQKFNDDGYAVFNHKFTRAFTLSSGQKIEKVQIREPNVGDYAAIDDVSGDTKMNMVLLSRLCTPGLTEEDVGRMPMREFGKIKAKLEDFLLGAGD